MTNTNTQDQTKNQNLNKEVDNFYYATFVTLPLVFSGGFDWEKIVF